MNPIDKLIKIEEAELGYLEKRSNSQLDDKTANAGSANYTKYWRDVKPDYQGQPWCAAFQSDCILKAFGLEMAKKLLKHWPYVYVPTIANLFTRHANPQKGDIVCFWSKSKQEFVHTGLVIAVDGDLFYTIEGNTANGTEIVPNGGAVCKKSYYNSKLPGTKFIRPDYSIVEEDEEGMTSEEITKFNTLVGVVESLTHRMDALEQNNKVYHYFKDLPDWGRPVIQELYDRGLYKGNGPEDLNLPESLLRTLVVNYRAGVYNK